MTSFPHLARFSRTALVMVFVTLVALVIRGWQLSQRTFYWDDLVIPARFRVGSFFDFFSPYDGHIMPGSIAIQVVADQLAPLEFFVPATIVLLLCTLTYCLYGCALTRLLPAHPQVRLLAFSALVFSPFLMVAAGWWSAALNALGWQVGFAAMLLCLSFVPAAPKGASHTAPTASSSQKDCANQERPHSRELAWGILAAFITFGALLMTEKAISIVPAAIVGAWLARRLSWRFFCAPTLVTLAWALFIERCTNITSTSEASTVMESIPKAVSHAVLPAILGGPWQWDRWTPSQAFAAPAPWLWIPSFMIVLLAIGLWVWRSPARFISLIPIVGYFLVIMLVLTNTRTGAGTTDLLARNLHYYVDWWALAVIVVALATARFPALRHSPLPRVAPIVVLILALSSAVTTISWVSAWRDDPTARYLATLKESVAQDPSPLLSQPVPLEILTPLLSPHNTVEGILGRPAATWVTEPKVVDNNGAIVPAAVLHSAMTEQGDAPQCGTRIASGKRAILHIDNPLPFGEWTWEMNAVASNKGMTVTLTTPNGLETEQQSRQRASNVPVPTELATHFVRVDGGGGFLQVEVTGGHAGDSVCIGAGGIGPLLASEN